MISWQSKISYPFVYLDSSSILRDCAFHKEEYTRQAFKRNPVKFYSMLKNAQQVSLKDNKYYDTISTLLLNQRISMLITMETLSPCVLSDDKRVIHLFGEISSTSKGNNSLDEFKHKEIDNLVLWNESTEIKKYNNAAMTLVNANCVVADASFFQVSIGISLADYIRSETPIIISAIERVEINIGDNYTMCGLPPNEMIKCLLANQ